MSQIQLIQITPEELQNQILKGIDTRLEKLSKNFQPKEPTKFLGRHDVAEMLNVGITTVHNWTVSGFLKSYGIGRRVYYKREEVEAAIVELQK